MYAVGLFVVPLLADF